VPDLALKGAKQTLPASWQVYCALEWSIFERRACAAPLTVQCRPLARRRWGAAPEVRRLSHTSAPSPAPPCTRALPHSVPPHAQSRSRLQESCPSKGKRSAGLDVPWGGASPSRHSQEPLVEAMSAREPYEGNATAGALRMLHLWYARYAHWLLDFSIAYTRTCIAHSV
jgi:hypothetical protein